MCSKSNEQKVKNDLTSSYSASSEDIRKPRFSSDVIKDAKNWCALRAINTKRPSTPLDSQRSLFGSDFQRSSRPPSTYSLGAHHFDPNDPTSRPCSGAPAVIKSKLPPLNHKKLVSKIDLLSVKRKSHSAGVGNQISESNMPLKAERRLSLVTSETGDSERKEIAEKKIDEESESTLRYHPAPSQNKHDKLNSDTPSSNDSNSSRHTPVRDKETKEEAFYWNTTILPLLEQLEDFSSTDTNKLCEICQKLHEALDKKINFQSMISRRRGSLLSTLFRLLNVPSNQLHLICARIILQVRVNNKNLTSVCKLLFRISRDRNHDDLFIKNSLIPSMLNVIEISDNVTNRYEALVYLCGSLKCLSQNKVALSMMYLNNCVKILSEFVQKLLFIIKTSARQKKLNKQALDILVQVMAVMRNLLDADKKVSQCSPNSSIMLEVLQMFSSDRKLTWILSRFFSKLTVYNSAINHVTEHKNWHKIFLKVLNFYLHDKEIVVRICFVLGNILSHNKSSCDQLYDCSIEEGSITCMDIMLKILEDYQNDKDSDLDEKNVDVLIKVIRVIANISISLKVGKLISQNSRLVDVLISITDSEKLFAKEEIITNSLVALNNLAYYDNTVSDLNEQNAIYENRLQLTSILIKLILNESMMLYIVEIARVLGNLTKYLDVRELIHQNKVDMVMVALIDSRNSQIVYNACGTLINISTDIRSRKELITEQIISKLSDVMKDFSPFDWLIPGIACQLTWNLLSSNNEQDINELFEENQNEMMVLKKTLETLLDETIVQQRINDVILEDDKPEDLMMSWKEDFCKFAQPLLARLNNFVVSSSSNYIPI